MSKIESPSTFNDRAKFRLRLAARFLRLDGQQFNKGDFYAEVLSCIAMLNQTQITKLRSLVNWIEDYEMTEQKIYGIPPRSRAQKKNRVGNKGALRPSASGAMNMTNDNV